MKELLMMKGAKTLVDVATKVQAGETVLLVTDYAKTDIAQAVAAVACDRGAEVMIMCMKPRSRGRRHEKCGRRDRARQLLYYPYTCSKKCGDSRSSNHRHDRFHP